MTSQVRDYDRHHRLSKDFNDERSLAICNNLKSYFSEKLLDTREKSKKEFKEWEISFLEQNRRLPQKEDIDEERMKIRKRFLNAEKMIKHWTLADDI